MRYVVADYETASRADLRKEGAWKYSADLSTFMLSLQIKVVTDGKPVPTRVLTEKQIHALDPEIMELANDPNVIWVCHNGGFEQGMWHHHMVPIGYPALPPERWHDTMAVCAMKGLPLGLGAVVTALDLPIQKDTEGHAHMLKMCKPDRLGGWSQHNAFNLERLYQYGATDADAQYGLYIATLGLGPSERDTWILDQYTQQRGLRIDTEFVHACMHILDQVRIPMTKRFREITGGLNPTQREKILDWVNEQGVRLSNMTKATLNAILDPDDEFDVDILDAPLPEHVYEALSLRRALASSSVAKLQRMLDCASPIDGRVRYSTQYHGARTGRDAGRLIQIQNYPRGEISDRQEAIAAKGRNVNLTAETLAEAIMTRDIEEVRWLWCLDPGGKDWHYEIFSAIISSLRSCIVPEPGKILVSGDFQGVEAKNLWSFAGQHDRAEQMHMGVDVYSENASLIFKKPVNKKLVFERTIGKCSTLGNGYGLGAIGFRARFAPKHSVEFAETAVKSYRTEFAPLVPKFWYGLYQASVDAVWDDHKRTHSYEGIEFRLEGDFLTMRLPSGRKIWYHRPRRENNWHPIKQCEVPGWSFMSYQGKKFRRILAWHGMITADCIQGSARCLMIEAAKRARKEGLLPIFKVHDELVFEEINRPDLVIQVKQIMEDIDPWARERKLRIKAEVESMARYRK